MVHNGVSGSGDQFRRREKYFKSPSKRGHESIICPMGLRKEERSTSSSDELQHIIKEVKIELEEAKDEHSKVVKRYVRRMNLTRKSILKRNTVTKQKI